MVHTSDNENTVMAHWPVGEPRYALVLSFRRARCRASCKYAVDVTTSVRLRDSRALGFRLAIDEVSAAPDRHVPPASSLAESLEGSRNRHPILIIGTPTATPKSVRLVVEFPLWPVFLLFMLYPGVSLLLPMMRRTWRRNRNLCVTCGYNMTGNTSGICPECAHPAPPPAGGGETVGETDGSRTYPKSS